MSPHELTERLKAEAIRLGFDEVGIAPAVTPPGLSRLPAWLEAGHAAGHGIPGAAGAGPLSSRGAARRRPVGRDGQCRLRTERSRSRDARRVLAVGKVARYARGADYHRVLWDKLGALLDWLRAERPEIHGRAVVDTAPLLERDFARLAGLGWIGKNTMLISRRLGSFTFLGALLTDVELAYDAPHHANHCGTCTRCLDACPTDAFAGPYQLDARRCISYWTIEHRGHDPRSGGRAARRLGLRLRHLPGRLPVESQGAAGADGRVRCPGRSGPSPTWSDGSTTSRRDWRARLEGTAPRACEARRAGAQRRARARDPRCRRGRRRRWPRGSTTARRIAVVRSAAAWALGRIATDEAQAALDRTSRRRRIDVEVPRAVQTGVARHGETTDRPGRPASRPMRAATA